MGDVSLPWPEFPVLLLTDRTSPHAQAAWEEWLRSCRQTDWHGPMPALPGTEIVVRHAYAREVLSDGERFPQRFTGSFRAMAALNPNAGPDFHALLDEMDASSLINQGGERHKRLRAVLGRAFTARNINQTRPFIRDLASRLLAGLSPGDDFVSGFAVQIPSTTLCQLVGIPEPDRPRLAAWVDELAVLLSPLKLLTLTADEAAAVVEARASLIAYGCELLAERRTSPSDDLMSHLAALGGSAGGSSEDDGFDDRALALNIADLLFGGNDNTQRALGMMLLVLVDHPDVWDEVAANPDFADDVVEECLRFRPPSPGAFRRTACPMQYDGADWPADQALWASAYSANRDEEVFDHSTEFDVHRANARDHLSFGHGAHFCIGANLARAEMQECLRVLTATLTCPQLDGEVVIVNEGAAGVAHLPLTFTRRP
jgi:cytochrome P450